MGIERKWLRPNHTTTAKHTTAPANQSTGEEDEDRGDLVSVVGNAHLGQSI